MPDTSERRRVGAETAFKRKKHGLSYRQAGSSENAYHFLEQERNRKASQPQQEILDYAASLDYEMLLELCPERVRYFIQVVQPLVSNYMFAFVGDDPEGGVLSLAPDGDRNSVVTIKIVESDQERDSHLKNLLEANRLKKNQLDEFLIKNRLIIIVSRTDMSWQKVSNSFLSFFTPIAKALK